jgi:hypothetical protein
MPAMTVDRLHGDIDCKTVLIVTTWLWGDAYGEHYVRRLAKAVHRNLNEAHRFIAFTDSAAASARDRAISDPEH